MLISRACLARVGTWDESFFLYSEETDFALRARDSGYVLRYIPDVEVEDRPKVFRKIKVDIPTLPTAKIRARIGYFPNGVPGAVPLGQ